MTSGFPRIYWELGDQMRRSCLSVILNLAEGSVKKSDKEFNRFIKISLGSINELVACLDVSLEAKLINERKFNDLKSRSLEIANQLGGFSKFLR